MPFVSGHTMTPKGPVWVNWEPLHWSLEVRIPKGVTATLSLPEALRGKRVECVHAGTPPERGSGLEYRLTEEGAYLFTAR